MFITINLISEKVILNFNQTLFEIFFDEKKKLIEM